jgi:hypothetical protein
MVPSQIQGRNRHNRSTLVSLPIASYEQDWSSIDSKVYINLLINLKDPQDTQFTAELVKALQLVVSKNFDVVIN